MKAAHEYARRLAEERNISYREALTAAMKEGWQAGRAWKGTPVGWKSSLRYRAFEALAKKEDAKKSPEKGRWDDVDPLDFAVLMSSIRMDAEFERKHPRDHLGRWTEKGNVKAAVVEDTAPPAEAKRDRARRSHQTEVYKRSKEKFMSLVREAVKPDDNPDSLLTLAEWKREEIVNGMEATISGLSDKAMTVAAWAVERVAAYHDLNDLTMDLAIRHGLDIPEGRRIGGAWEEKASRRGKGVLHVDGPTPMINPAAKPEEEGVRGGVTNLVEHVYAHELGHVLDVRFDTSGKRIGLISETTDWNIAWENEIYFPMELTSYARSHPVEGWAEFTRLCVLHPDYARENFPDCWAVWKSHGYALEDHDKISPWPADAA